MEKELEQEKDERSIAKWFWRKKAMVEDRVSWMEKVDKLNIEQERDQEVGKTGEMMKH